MSGATTPTTSNPPVLTRWDPSKACSPNFYYDEPKSDSNFPPDFLDMTDFWVAEICRANIKAGDKARRWPSVFSSKWLADTYQTKGPAAKHKGADGQWCYTVVFNRFQMHGQEGIDRNLDRKLPNRLPYSRNSLEDGAHCDAPPGVTETKKADGKAHRKSSRIAGQQSTQTSSSGTKAKSSGAKATTSDGKAKSSNAKATTSDAKTKSSDAKATTSTAKTKSSDAKATTSTAKTKSSDAKATTSDAKATSSDTKQTTKRQNDASSSPANKRQKTSTPIKQENVAYTIVELSESDNDSELRTLREENKALKAKAKADSTMEEKLRASDAKFILLADTTASIHGAINPLINRAFEGTSLLKKAYTSMTDDKLKKEVREFYKGHSSAINGIVNESQSKVVKVLKSHSELVILFDHSEESKAKLQDLLHTSATETPKKKKSTRKEARKTATPKTHLPPATHKGDAAASPAAASPAADVKANADDKATADVKAEIVDDKADEIIDDKADETTDVKANEITDVKQSISGGDDGAAVEVDKDKEDEGDEEDEAGKENSELTDEEDEAGKEEEEDEAGKEDSDGDAVQ